MLLGLLWEHRDMGAGPSSIDHHHPHHPHHHHHPPVAVDEHASKAGLRAVATFEAAKGMAVLLLGIALLLIHHHVEDYAEALLFHLHIDTDRRLGHMLMRTALQISDLRLWMIAGAVLTYCGVRFVEAWGLWNRRVWAEWFALLSGGLYLPFEILKIAERPDWERIGVFVINVVIVIYMLVIRIEDLRGVGYSEPVAEEAPKTEVGSKP